MFGWFFSPVFCLFTLFLPPRPTPPSHPLPSTTPTSAFQVGQLVGWKFFRSLREPVESAAWFVVHSFDSDLQKYGLTSAQWFAEVSCATAHDYLTGTSTSLPGDQFGTRRQQTPSLVAPGIQDTTAPTVTWLGDGGDQQQSPRLRLTYDYVSVAPFTSSVQVFVFDVSTQLQ
jgi:hypothetical protein